MGNYYLNNNQWNVDNTGTSGSQCIWYTCQSGNTIGWGTDWNWTQGDSQYSVKTYASAVYGWQWTDNSSLGVQLSSGANINCDMSFAVSQSGTMNVAYDLWIHSMSNPGYSDDPDAEVMIWLYAAGGSGPASDSGSPVATVSIGGTSWNLYYANNSPYASIISFVRTNNTTSASLNLMDFLDEAVSRGYISSSQYLSSIQSGPEIFEGSGQLDVHSYSCTIQ